MVKYGIYAVSKLREPGKLVAEAKDLRMKNGKGTAGVHPGVQKAWASVEGEETSANEEIVN